MLPLVILALFVLGAPPAFAQSDYREPTATELQRERHRADRALQEASRLFQDPSFLEALRKDRANARSADAAASAPARRSLPNTLPHNIPLADRAVSAAEHIRQAQHPHYLDDRIRPLVLISFGLPDTQLRTLLAEARRLDAAVYLRGLVNDDWKDTISALHALAEDGLGHVSIDPTVFQRFHIALVPAFVLPLEKLIPCTNDGCPPVRHVRAAGAVSLTYFLEYVTRTGTAPARRKATNWLSAHKAPPAS